MFSWRLAFQAGLTWPLAIAQKVAGIAAPPFLSSNLCDLLTLLSYPVPVPLLFLRWLALPHHLSLCVVVLLHVPSFFQSRIP